MSEEIINENALATQGPTEVIKPGGTFVGGGHFEYKVVPVGDLLDGGANVSKIEDLLNLYAEMGWRLSQTVVNQIGAVPFANKETGSMASVQEQTLLIFERWVQA